MPVAALIPAATSILSAKASDPGASAPKSAPANNAFGGGGDLMQSIANAWQGTQTQAPGQSNLQPAVPVGAPPAQPAGPNLGLAMAPVSSVPMQFGGGK